MLPPGTEEPGLAALPPGGDLYFERDTSLQNPGQVFFGGGRSAPTGAQSLDAAAPTLYFPNTQAGQPAYTGTGEQILQASRSSRGHVGEILNFHGSPAPWILIGLLLVAGILHLQASGNLGVRGGV
jgi:hypothetical protein